MEVNQKGFSNLLLPVVLIIIVSVFAGVNIPASNGNQIQGVSIAKAANGNGNGNRENGNSNKPDSNENSTQNRRSDQSEENKPEKTENITSENKNNKPETATTNLLRKQETKESSKEADLEDDESTNSGEDLEDVRNITNFPLRIDPATGQLIMTKGGVDRVLTVLPAKAVLNMLLAHIKTGAGPKFFGEATLSATLSGQPISTESAGISVDENQIVLQQINEQPVYRIPAKKLLKVFGFIPVTTDFTSFVSAQTGQIVREDESLLSRILSFLSTN